MTDSPAVEIPDDLDAFSDLFYGKAKPEVEDPVEKVEEIKEDEVPEEVEETDETDAPESEDEVDEADPEDEDPEDEKPQRRNRKTAKERIKELTAEREDALRQLAIEREVSKRLKEAETKPLPAEDPKEVETAPSPDDVNDKGEPLYPLGEFDPSYIRALSRYTVEQEVAKATKTLEEQRKQTEATAVRERQQQEWLARLDTAEKELPDVREKIASLEVMFADIKPEYGQYLVDVIQSLDNGPAILHYLGDHPKEAQQIVAAGYTGATLSLGRIDAQIGSKASQKEPAPKVTKAPPPPKAVSKGGGGKFTVPDDTDDLDAFAQKFFLPKKR